MPSFLALLTFLLAAGVHVERVSVPGPNGIKLDAALVLPEGAVKMPPVVALHGCGGPAAIYWNLHTPESAPVFHTLRVASGGAPVMASGGATRGYPVASGGTR